MTETGGRGDQPEPTEAGTGPADSAGAAEDGVTPPQETAAEAAQPADAAPAQPADVAPAETAAAEPAKPAAAEPAKPAAAEPAQPADAEPAQPAAAEPAKPADAEPAKPAAAEPAKPAEACSRPKRSSRSTARPPGGPHGGTAPVMPLRANRRCGRAVPPDPVHGRAAGGGPWAPSPEPA